MRDDGQDCRDGDAQNRQRRSPPKDAQVLAPHSTITLTMDRYTHLREANLQAALDKLPEVPDGKPKRRKKRT